MTARDGGPFGMLAALLMVVLCAYLLSGYPCDPSWTRC